MGWHWNSGGNRRQGGNWWIIALVIMGILLISNSGGDWNWGWSWWLIFIVPWFIVPRLWRTLRSSNDERRDAYEDEYEDEKPKHDFEKPKRSFTSEDGSEFEIIEEENPPRKRRETPDDIDYV